VIARLILITISLLPFLAIGLIAWGAAAIYWPAAPIVTGLWLLFDLYRKGKPQ